MSCGGCLFEIKFFSLFANAPFKKWSAERYYESFFEMQEH